MKPNKNTRVPGKLTTLVIDRRKWLRGTNDGTLLNTEGKMCCLGFACRKIGIAKDKLLDGTMPLTSVIEHKVDESTFATNIWMIEGNGSQYDVGVAAVLNDRPGDFLFPETEREAGIKNIFAKHGCKVILGTKP